MNNKRIEKALKNAVEQTTPDVLDNILSQCGEQNGKVMNMKNSNNKKIITSMVSIAAALVIMLGGFFVFRSFEGNSIYSTVTLDVNPSIEISLTEKEKVLEVKALNEDAKVVLGEMDFKGSSLEVTVNALIGSMLRNGYIDELSNSILISVDSKNDADGKALREKLNKEVEKLLQTDKFTGAVLSQTVEHNDELDDKSEKYDITVGKAQLINQIIASDNRYTFEQLAPLTINELNLISQSGEKIDSSVDKSGTASEKKYIGYDKAKNIALEHAGVTENSITEYDSEFDYENGKMVYEIEFKVGTMEYEYDIDAISGEIVKSHKEIDDDDSDDRKENAVNGSGNSNGNGNGNGGAENGNENANQNSSVTGNSYISKADAKSAALTHAGVTAENCREIEAELDNDDGVVKYQVEFKSGGFEYEYDIDATTGKVLNVEKEPLDR